MSEDQVTQILTAIGDARQESTKALGELATQVGMFKGNIEARVEAVEDSAKTAKKQAFILTYIVIPVMTLAHGVAAHFGVKI